MPEKREYLSIRGASTHNLKNQDADIIEKLNSVDNKQGYIKRLIREDAK